MTRFNRRVIWTQKLRDVVLKTIHYRLSGHLTANTKDCVMCQYVGEKSGMSVIAVTTKECLKFCPLADKGWCFKYPDGDEERIKYLEKLKKAALRRNAKEG